MAILSNIFSWNFINLMSVLTIGLLVSGHLIWIVERGSNEKQFPAGYLDGVDDGLWWSIVTMVPHHPALLMTPLSSAAPPFTGVLRSPGLYCPALHVLPSAALPHFSLHPPHIKIRGI